MGNILGNIGGGVGCAIAKIPNKGKATTCGLILKSNRMVGATAERGGSTIHKIGNNLGVNLNGSR